MKISGGASGTVLYAYDEAGHLLGEYDGTGTLIQETIWLGDIPVATLRPNGAAVALYYVHSDQLNTPREVTRPSDNVAMWTWNSDPFGTDAANPNRPGAGRLPTTAASRDRLRWAGEAKSQPLQGRRRGCTTMGTAPTAQRSDCTQRAIPAFRRPPG